MTTVHLKYYIDDEQHGINDTLLASTDLIAHWIVVDLAGSEGMLCFDLVIMLKSFSFFFQICIFGLKSFVLEK